ncbi:MAG: CUAEP/CCAEP-tail radical SAM (seleno)protein, partial [Acidimicrobiales bacterium]
MRVLLVSTYELGHQPLHVASPAGALLEAGHQVRCWDLAVQPWSDGADALLGWADAAAFSVPMHTA